jgi:hypothetical protein
LWKEKDKVRLHQINILDEPPKEEKERPSKPKDPFHKLYSKEKYQESANKDYADESIGKVKKIAVLVARGDMLLAVVLHVVFKFYGGEYDPLYVERVKQTLFI